MSQFRWCTLFLNGHFFLLLFLLLLLLFLLSIPNQAVLVLERDEGLRDRQQQQESARSFGTATNSRRSVAEITRNDNDDDENDDDDDDEREEEKRITSTEINRRESETSHRLETKEGRFLCLSSGNATVDLLDASTTTLRRATTSEERTRPSC